MRRIILVRHGQSEMNVRQSAIVGGQSNDSPLTATGVAQAKALGRHLARYLAPHPAPALAASSPAVRARDTARIALLEAGHNAAASAVALHESAALLELGQGSWEGKPRDECYTPAALAAIAADPWNFAAPGGGESQRAVEARVTAFVTDEVLPRVQPGGPPALLFAHGLAIKCFLRGVLGSDAAVTWKIRLDNASVAEVAWRDAGPAAGWHVLRVNDTSHLTVEGVEVT